MVLKKLYIIVMGVGVIGLSTIFAAAAPASADISRGKAIYARCVACHSIMAQSPKKLGPHLQNLNGRRAGSVPGFKYSPVMTKSAIRWNDATLERFLQKPSSVVPGTTMAFVGISNAEDRKALIAYLKKPN